MNETVRPNSSTRALCAFPNPIRAASQASDDRLNCWWLMLPRGPACGTIGRSRSSIRNSELSHSFQNSRQREVHNIDRLRYLHIVQLLFLRELESKVEFRVYPHDKWTDNQGRPYLTLPTKKTVTDPLAPFLQGTSIEAFVDSIATRDLDLERGDYAIELE